MKARSRLKNALMRNHTYATFPYLKDKDFLVFKFFEIAYTRFCHLFSSPFTICSYEVLYGHRKTNFPLDITYKALSQAEFECFESRHVKKQFFEKSAVTRFRQRANDMRKQRRRSASQ